MACNDTTFNPSELVKEWTDSGLPLYPLLKHNNFYDVMVDLFDPLANEDPKDPNYFYPDLIFKGFPVSVELTKVNKCCQVEWTEQTIDYFPATTVKNPISGDQICFSDVDDRRKWRGISTGSQVIVTRLSGESCVTYVKDIVGDCLILEDSIVADVGDVVSRGPKYRIIGDCERCVEDVWTDFEASVAHSNFASIPVSVRIDLCELNMDREMYDAGYDVDDWVKNEVVLHMQGFKVVFSQALLWGNNSIAHAGKGSQSMSFFTGLQQAQACVNPTLDATKPYFIHNFGPCCEDAEDDCEILETFRENVIFPAMRSGAYGNGVHMNAWANDAQLIEFQKLGHAIIDVFGGAGICHKTCDDGHDGLVYNNFEMQSFKIGNTKFIYKYSEILTKLFPNTPVLYIFPREWVALKQYAYKGVSANFKTKMAKEGSPRLELIDASPLYHMKSGSTECSVFKGNFTYALCIYNMCSGAYQLVFNLKAKSSCEFEACAVPYAPFKVDDPATCPTHECLDEQQQVELNPYDEEGIEDGDPTDDTDPDADAEGGGESEEGEGGGEK